ncbi:MAG: hypothetical protein K0S04_3808 [Herbinix sp.]|nr:hypothetical protein [Herbinix sp.]
MDKKYESDLTFKEKRKLELQKIKNLSWQKRMEYLWTYYRYLIIVALAVILVIGTGVTMFQNQQRTQLLSIAIIDANPDKITAIEELKEELLSYLGQKNKQDEVFIDTAATSVDTEENTAKLVMVMSFVDWKELLGDEYETYETYMTDGIIDLSRMSKWEEGGYTSYSPAYLCVLKKSEHLEKARSFLDYFLE